MKLIRISRVLLLSFLPMLSSCGGGRENDIVLDFQAMPEVSYEESLPQLDTIFLDDGNEVEFSISEIDKILIKDESIYVSDCSNGKIIRFDKSGSPISSLLRKGRGPQEYLRITDFDVVDGMTIIMDGQSDRLFFYEEDGGFNKRLDLPFEAYAFAALDDGRFLFNLAPWNEGRCQGKKLAVADSDMNALRSDIPYDGVFDSEFSFSSVAFASSGSSISFNQPIDDHVYVMDGSGKMISKYSFDFGEATVPIECRKHIEDHLDEFKDFAFITNVVYADDNIVLGTLKDHGEYKDFIVDVPSGIKAVQKGGSAFRLRSVTGGCAVFQDMSSSSFVLYSAPLSSFVHHSSSSLPE